MLPFIALTCLFFAYDLLITFITTIALVYNTFIKSLSLSFFKAINVVKYILAFIYPF